MQPSDRRRNIWHLVMGPVLALAIAGALLLLARAGGSFPVPGAFFVAAIVLATYIGGALAGYLSAAVTLAVQPILLSEPGLTMVPARDLRLQIMAVVVLLVPIVTVYLRNRVRRGLDAERTMRERAEAANRELLTLRAELVRHAQELERLATTDDLTDLCNRRHFLARAEEERRRHARDREPLALALFDIDHFKSVNDRFGHDVGDDVIRHVAAVCRGTLRETDILARFGGEEFVLLLPQTTADEAMARAEAMRVRLEASPFELDGAEVRVTISVGIAEADAEAQRIGGLMKRADQALYRAKRDGRNRVQRADSTPSHRRKFPAASAA